jgi:hypothetical protein
MVSAVIAPKMRLAVLCLCCVGVCGHLNPHTSLLHVGDGPRHVTQIKLAVKLAKIKRLKLI